MQIIGKYLLNIFKFIVFAAFSISFFSCGNKFPVEVTTSPTATIAPQFDGERAFQHVVSQLDFGERTPGSIGHNKTVDWMVDELTSSKWDVSIQELPYSEHVIRNVIAKRGSGKPWIILGAHYDTRIFADQDQDPEMQLQLVPGANDGASGVAVLLELARVLPADLPGEIWFVFFDAEDNGNIPGWDWILGSQAFVGVLEGLPDAVVIIDMIGDKDLNIFWEKNSDFELTKEIWQVAADLGYDDYFISQPGYRILDDHMPFVRVGIPAVDIIDFDYPAWHTVDDTIDKVSARSLKVVGDVLYHWLLTKRTISSAP
jgi:Zn-dependent M28 family amino/carboxypeptidase